jgi:hypothetical protein
VRRRELPCVHGSCIEGESFVVWCQCQWKEKSDEEKDSQEREIFIARSGVGMFGWQGQRGRSYGYFWLGVSNLSVQKCLGLCFVSEHQNFCGSSSTFSNVNEVKVAKRDFKWVGA